MGHPHTREPPDAADAAERERIHQQSERLEEENVWDEACFIATQSGSIGGIANGTGGLHRSGSVLLSSSPAEIAHRTPPGELGEASTLLRLAIPLAATNVCGFAINLVSIAFVGRLLGKQELAAAVLSTTLFNVTGLSLIQGLNATLETFCGQAWGAENHHLVGIYLQRALALDSLFTLVIILCWRYLSIPALLLIGQTDAAFNALVARYLMLLAPGLWFAAVYEAVKRYLAAQGAGHPQAVVSALALALSPLFNWVLIYQVGLGFDGAALAVVAVNVVLAATLVMYAVVLEGRRVAAGVRGRAWSKGWSKEAFTEWGKFLSHAGPSIVMLCAEWWTFELLVILAGWLPDPQFSLAVMGICVNLSSLTWSIVSGLSLACSARVASTLGAGFPEMARQATFVSLGIGLSFEVINACVVVGFRHEIGAIFTSSATLIHAVAAVMPIFALGLLGDGANCVLQGLLRGSGKQALGAVANLSSYWAVGLPMAYYLGFSRGLGLQGLWGGIAIANTLQGTVMFGIALWVVDFEAESRKAVQRSTSSTLDGGGGGGGGGSSSIVLPLLEDVEDDGSIP